MNPQTIRLGDTGYKITDQNDIRQAILKTAVEKYGNLQVRRHLNLLRNFMDNAHGKQVIDDDITFLEMVYSGCTPQNNQVLSYGKQVINDDITFLEMVYSGCTPQNNQVLS